MDFLRKSGTQVLAQIVWVVGLFRDFFFKESEGHKPFIYDSTSWAKTESRNHCSKHSSHYRCFRHLGQYKFSEKRQMLTCEQLLLRQNEQFFSHIMLRTSYI